MSDSVKWDIKQRIFFSTEAKLDDYKSKWPLADSKAIPILFRFDQMVAIEKLVAS